MSKMAEMAQTIEELRTAAASINAAADWLYPKRFRRPTSHQYRGNERQKRRRYPEDFSAAQHTADCRTQGERTGVAFFTSASSFTFMESGRKLSLSAPMDFSRLSLLRLVPATGYPCAISSSTRALPSPFEHPVTSHAFLLMIYSFPNEFLHILMTPCVLLTFEEFAIVVNFSVKHSQTEFQFLHFTECLFFLLRHQLVPFR